MSKCCTPRAAVFLTVLIAGVVGITGGLMGAYTSMLPEKVIGLSTNTGIKPFLTSFGDLFKNSLLLTCGFLGGVVCFRA